MAGIQKVVYSLFMARLLYLDAVTHGRGRICIHPRRLLEFYNRCFFNQSLWRWIADMCDWKPLEINLRYNNQAK